VAVAKVVMGHFQFGALERVKPLTVKSQHITQCTLLNIESVLTGAGFQYLKSTIGGPKECRWNFQRT
jgi:hypothetical protein